MLYRYRLDRKNSYPDPASRFQPDGPHGPSQIIDPGEFGWTDGSWRGIQLAGQIVYEMHIGTFTREGTWNAATLELERLAQLGVTALEIMPVADFSGTFGWGYDGVDLYAPTRLYGMPDDFRRFVDCAHGTGLAVVLDVVYNHFGPDGAYFKDFSDDYFTDRYENEWGMAINFDGKNSAPVREFITANAAYWIAEFHIDGLRLDAKCSTTASISAACMSLLIFNCCWRNGVHAMSPGSSRSMKRRYPRAAGRIGCSAITIDRASHLVWDRHRRA